MALPLKLLLKLTKWKGTFFILKKYIIIYIVKCTYVEDEKYWKKFFLWNIQKRSGNKFTFSGNQEITKKDGVNSSQLSLLVDNLKYTCRADKVAYIDRFDSAFSVQDFNLISRSSVLLKDLDMFSSMEEREDWTELSSLDWVSTFSKTSFSLVSARADRS